MQGDAFTRRCLTSSFSSSFTARTCTHEHQCFSLWGDYRSDFSLVEIQEDDSGRLNHGAMNQCLIKPLALGMNCQHGNSVHTHTNSNVSVPQWDTATTSRHLTAQRGSCQDSLSLSQFTVRASVQLFSQ